MKRFHLGDLIKHNGYNIGIRVITSIEKGYYRVLFLEGKFEGKSYRLFNTEGFVKIGNIFDKKENGNGRKEID